MHKAGESFLIKYQLVVALQQEVQTAGKTSAPLCTDMGYLQKTAKACKANVEKQAASSRQDVVLRFKLDTTVDGNVMSDH